MIVDSEKKEFLNTEQYSEEVILQLSCYIRGSVPKLRNEGINYYWTILRTLLELFIDYS